jgi:hypothetical protein
MDPGARLLRSLGRNDDRSHLRLLRFPSSNSISRCASVGAALFWSLSK